VPREVSTEAAAYELLEQLRWGAAPPPCPHCGTVGRCRYLASRTGTSRATRTGAVSQRRVWKCGACGRQFSVLVGTVLQGTRISLRTWIAVALAYTAADARLTAREVAAEHGLSPAAARQLLRRLEYVLGPGRLTARYSGAEALTALVRLSPEDAARVREQTPPRVRPRPQRGPTADYR
jgi:transposase-like protein